MEICPQIEPGESKHVLYIVCGLPGSGKSTYVNQAALDGNIQVVCPEDMRRALGHRYFGPVEPLVHAISMAQARAHMLRNVADVMLDETGIRAAHLRKWKGIAEAHGYRARLVFLDTPADVCRMRRGTDPSYPLQLIDTAADRLASERKAIFGMFGPGDRDIIVWSPEIESDESSECAQWAFS